MPSALEIQNLRVLGQCEDHARVSSRFRLATLFRS